MDTNYKTAVVKLIIYTISDLYAEVHVCVNNLLHEMLFRSKSDGCTVYVYTVYAYFYNSISFYC